jgi:uncharacterized protein (TIGR02679 family)
VTAGDFFTSSELRAYLGRPELARLWAAARERVERLGRVGGTVRLDGASSAERRALADLLGLAALPGEKLSVSLSRLDRSLRSSRFALGLVEALELVSGPLRDLPAEREARRREREAIWEEAEHHPALAAHPGLGGWLQTLRASGLPVRLAGEDGARELLQDALSVLAFLLAGGAESASGPGAGPGATRFAPLRLGVLASGTLGSSHALDAGSPAATLVLQALAHLSDQAPPRGAAERRALWERHGVVLDDLSSHVLVLGLAPEAGCGAVGEALRALAAAGEPARLTLSQLGRLPADLGLPCATDVRVCENPVVVAAAAERLGSRCPPLVCVEGVPSQAGRELLTAFAARGGTLLYHGDFDWAGVRIANSLAETLPFRPWRFAAADYRDAVEQAGPGEAGAPTWPALSGESVAAVWDPALATAMARAGLAVEEEAVLGELLEDLAR